MIDNSQNCADGESERAQGTLGLCRSASCVARQNMRPVDGVNQRSQPCDLPGATESFAYETKARIHNIYIPHAKTHAEQEVK